MQLVGSSLAVPLSFILSTNGPSKKTCDSSIFHRLFGSHAPAGVTQWTWEHTKVRALRMLELMPDLFTMSDCINTLTQTYYSVIPTTLKVTFAAIGSLNLFNIPILARAAFDLACASGNKLMRNQLGPDRVIKLAYLSFLTALMVALGAYGLKEFCKLGHVSGALFERICNAILPWIGYALRIGMVLQVMDIVAGIAFNSKVVKLNKSVDCKARVNMNAMKAHRRFLRRANGGSVKAKLDRLDAGLKSWNPVRYILAVHGTNKLAETLRNRSISHMRYQVFGLGANVTAFICMTLTNVVALCVFQMISAGFYMTQTMSSWNMNPSYKEPGVNSWF